MANSRNTSGKKSTSSRKAAETKNSKRLAEQRRREVQGLALIASGILLGIYLFISASGVLGTFLSKFFFGLCGWFAYGIPLVLLAAGIIRIMGKNGTTRGGGLFIIIGVVDIMTLAQTATKQDYYGIPFTKYIASAYEAGGLRRGGGVIGALFCYPMQQLGGNALCYVLTILVLLVVFSMLFRISYRDLGLGAKKRVESAVSSTVSHAREYVQQETARRQEDRRMRIYNMADGEPTELLEEDADSPVQGVSQSQPKHLITAADAPVSPAAAAVTESAPEKPKKSRRNDEYDMSAFNAFTADLPVSGAARRVTEEVPHAESSGEKLSYLGESDLQPRPRRTMTPRHDQRQSVARILNPEQDLPAGDAIWNDLEPSAASSRQTTSRENVSRSTYSAAAVSSSSGNLAGAGVKGTSPKPAPTPAPVSAFSGAAFTSVSGTSASENALKNASSIRTTPELSKEPAYHSVSDTRPKEAPVTVSSGIPGISTARQHATPDSTAAAAPVEDITALQDDMTPEEALRALRSPKPTASVPPVSDDHPAHTEEESATSEDITEEIVVSQPPVYIPPSLDLLARSSSQAYGTGNEDPASKGQVLIDTLKSFGIEAELSDYSVGPVITRFEIRPAKGVRVNKITALSNDLALALEASRVRIEAPIPGKAAVGIEIPNKHAVTVVLRDIIDSPEFQNAPSPIQMALGKDTGGKVLTADLAKMPHMLIAGSTGSGKSVCINDLLISMIYKASPQDLRLILIDPKVVELSVFAALPHLLIPVVTEPKKASSALRWAVNEMTLRYKKFSEIGSRDLARYNALMTDPSKRMPKLVIIIDELADLMMVAPDEVEDAICRIAQLGRAAGIHLIVATQRPSADIITGLIKANIPSRCAFAVSSGIDSRIILDETGAEKLLGRGDMLFHANGSGKPVRAQAAFVSDEEVEHIMDHFREKKQEPIFDESIVNDLSGDGKGGPSGGAFGEGKQEDELLGEAVRIVLESGQASISMIQRRLRVGYARAARLIDMMEQEGYVSGFEGSKPRRVLIKRGEFERIFGDGTYVEDASSTETDTQEDSI